MHSVQWKSNILNLRCACYNYSVPKIHNTVRSWYNTPPLSKCPPPSSPLSSYIPCVIDCFCKCVQTEPLALFAVSRFMFMNLCRSSSSPLTMQVTSMLWGLVSMQVPLISHNIWPAMLLSYQKVTVVIMNVLSASCIKLHCTGGVCSRLISK